MKLFLVSPKLGYVEQIEAKIKENFGENYMPLPKRPFPTWILAAKKFTTCIEVARSLGMIPLEEDNPPPTLNGVVVEIESYYGYDDLELWQKLEAWSKGQ